MIPVFMGDQYGRKVFRGTPNTGQALSDLACAKACVHQ
jgi:hypothetical protein